MTEINSIPKGIHLLHDLLDDDQTIPLAIEHDQFFFGSFSETVVRMTPEQVAMMRQWGWMEQGDTDSWFHWT